MRGLQADEKAGENGGVFELKQCDGQVCSCATRC